MRHIQAPQTISNGMSKSDYGLSDITSALKTAGIKRGDTLFTHAQVGFFGKAEGAMTKEKIYALFKKAVFDVIGPHGTWTMPTFSYSFFKKKIYDKNETPADMGILSEMMRKDPESLRSNDPNFSIAALGENARFLTEKAPAHSFGPDSFWERFLELRGKICNFNFDAGSTFIHYVEKHLAVPYRYDKAFKGTLYENGVEKETVFYHFVHDLDSPKLAADFRAFDAKAKQSYLAKVANLGRGQIVMISARDAFDLIKKELQKDPMFLTLSGFRTGALRESA